jgi:hypothetical protein
VSSCRCRSTSVGRGTVSTQLSRQGCSKAMAITGGHAPPKVILHSDRGCQYTSHEFARFCAGNKIQASVGRTGVCWDCAAAESFFATLKNEMYYRHRFDTRARARFAVAEYIEIFYNRRRLHSRHGYRTRPKPSAITAPSHAAPESPAARSRPRAADPSTANPPGPRRHAPRSSPAATRTSSPLADWHRSPACPRTPPLRRRHADVGQGDKSWVVLADPEGTSLRPCEPQPLIGGRISRQDARCRSRQRRRHRRLGPGS